MRKFIAAIILMTFCFFILFCIGAIIVEWFDIFKWLFGILFVFLAVVWASDELTDW